MAATDYRALVGWAATGDGRVRHLIREDAEAALCGIPRPILETGEVPHDLVCSDCIEWLTKRRAASARTPLVRRP